MVVIAIVLVASLVSVIVISVLYTKHSANKSKDIASLSQVCIQKLCVVAASSLSHQDRPKSLSVQQKSEIKVTR